MNPRSQIVESEYLQELAYGAGVKNKMGPRDAINKINLNFNLLIISGINGRLNGPASWKKNHPYRN